MNDKPFSHTVTVVVQSYQDDPNVKMEVKWEPTLSDNEIADLGYLPAAYHFVDTVLLTAAWMAQGEAEVEQEDMPTNRSLN